MGTQQTLITVQTKVNVPVKQTWFYFTTPSAVIRWNHASDDWHCPAATSELKPGGKFCYTMAAKDGSMSFDFEGTYTEVIPHQSLKYEIVDGRKVTVLFKETNGETEVVTTFDAENQNPAEMQQAGWQAILDSFKAFAEKSYGKG